MNSYSLHSIIADLICGLPFKDNQTIKYNGQRSASSIEYNRQSFTSLIENSVGSRSIESQKKLATIDDKCYSIQRKVKPTNTLETTSKKVTGSNNDNDEIDFRWTLQLIYKETKEYLESLGRAASEGRAVDEANNFLRWLQFSSVLRLLEKNSWFNPDFVTLRNRCNDLQAICRPYLQGRNMPASPSQARIDEVNAKLDIILAAMAKNISPSQTHTPDAGQPVLSVIAGEGASLLAAAG